MVKRILSLLFPPRCAFCDKVMDSDDFAICPDCIGTIPQNDRACRVCATPLDTVYGELLCPECRKRRRGFQSAYAPLIYKDAVRQSILGMKFGRKKARCKAYAALIFLKLREANAPRPDVITYMPMHFIRLGNRGFNQAKLIADHLGKMMHLPVLRSLVKTENTLPQSKKKGTERRRDLSGIYKACNPQNIAGKTVLLVDDVITTGATLESTARVLKRAGAKTVYAATVAATPFYH